MIQTKKYSILLRIFLLPFLIAVVSCFQIIFFDYAYGHDWIFELVRLEEYFNALKSGQILPYWAENLYNGFGSPIFLFYSPLYNLLCSIILMLGITLKHAAIIALTILMVISTIGMAGLMWELNKNSAKLNVISASRIAAIAYVLSPYLLANLLVRNASAELTALCIAPYSFWGLVMFYNNRKCGLILITIGISLSILAHNLTALSITAMLIISSIILFLKPGHYKNFLKAITSLIFGIGITTWFWLPALYLKKEVHIQEMTTGKFDFHNNFISLMDLFSYGYFYSAGLFALAVLIAGILLTQFKNYKHKLLSFYLIIIATWFLFLQLSASTLIWEQLPFMPLFQFPWRMMGPFSFCIALLSGIVVSQLKTKKMFVEILIISIIIINAIPLFNRYERLPSNVSDVISDSITAQGIMINGLPATVLNEYLPLDVDQSALDDTATGDVFLSRSAKQIKLESIENSRVHFSYESNQDLTIYPAYWYFPVWEAKINNTPLTLNRSPWGTLQIDVPAGEADVEFNLKQPQIRNIGFIISGFFLVSFLLYSCRNKYEYD